MVLLFALMLGTAAPAAPVLQHETASVAVQTLDGRADRIADLIVAKQVAEATALVDPLLEEFEKANAGEKRRIYCAADAAESRRYMAKVRAEKPASPAVVIGKGWCVALWAKGYLLDDAGQPAAAIPYLVRAAAMRPDHRQYWAELTFAYQATKAWPEMLDAGRQAAALAAEADEPDRTTSLCKAWHSMAYAQIELGHWDDATELLNKCLALDPGYEKAKTELEYIARSRPKT
ncbi:MAG: tetratricopeptide repeat protein [Sphingomonas sp.]